MLAKCYPLRQPERRKLLLSNSPRPYDEWKETKPMTRSRKRREDVNREEANQSVCTRPKKRPEENPEGEVDEVINRPEGKGSKRRKENTARGG